MSFMNKNGFMFLSSALLLTGCSIGQSEFTCSVGSENSVCASSRTVYKATNGEMKENETITYVEDGERKQITLTELEAIQSSEGVDEDGKTNVVVHNTLSVPYQYSYDGDAIRTPVTVMRIWIAPFVDQQDNLRMSQVLFTDMEKKSWKIADSEPQNFGVNKSAVVHRSNKLRVAEAQAQAQALETEEQDGSIYIDPASLQQIKNNFSQ